MNEIFKTFSNFGDTLLLDNCCTTDKCKEKKCYDNCLTCDSAPFCFTSPQLPCTVPKIIRKGICLKGKMIETFLNQAYCTITEAIKTNNFSSIVVPAGMKLLITNLSTQENMFSSFPNPPSPLSIAFLFISSFARNDDNECDSPNKIKLKFFLNTGYNPSSTTQISRMAVQGFSETDSVFGGTSSYLTTSNTNSGGNPSISSVGIVGGLP